MNNKKNINEKSSPNKNNNNNAQSNYEEEIKNIIKNSNFLKYNTNNDNNPSDPTLTTNTDNNINNTNVVVPAQDSEIKTALSCGEYYYFQKHKIGVGSFAEVYSGCHKKLNFRVAIKIPNDKANINAIEQEIKYSKLLLKEPAFPVIYNTYNYLGKNIIVETLVGPSLDKLFIYCGRQFPLKTVCLIGIQITKRLESMHKIGLIHRDIKPNIFLG